MIHQTIRDWVNQVNSEMIYEEDEEAKKDKKENVLKRVIRRFFV